MRLVFQVVCCAWLLASCTANPDQPAPPEIAYFTCSIHPNLHAPEDGSCPICGMSLTPVAHGDLESGAVLIDPVRRQRFGVRTAVVERRALTREIRAFGTVRWEKSRVHDLTVRGDTWIERLYVSETGTWVRRGQALALVYNPMFHICRRIGKFMLYNKDPRELIYADLRQAQTNPRHIAYCIDRESTESLRLEQLVRERHARR